MRSSALRTLLNACACAGWFGWAFIIGTGMARGCGSL
jgi:hypothetical protein